MEVRRYDGLEALPESYEALFLTAEKESFFNSALWYRVLLATTGSPGEEQRFYGLEESGSGRPLALLPAIGMPRRRGPYGSRLLSGCHNVYTLRFSPLIGEHVPDRRKIVHELVGALLLDRPRWDAVSLRMLDHDSDVFEYLLEAFDSYELVTEPYFQFGNWYEDVAGRSFDGYIADRGKSVKKTLAWKTRRFARRPDASCEIYKGGEGAERAITAFKTVYEASWKEPELHPDFIDRLMRSCVERGCLRLGNLFLGGAPVASWLIIVSNATAIGFKTAYDPMAPSNLSVGGVLTYNVMQYLIDEEKVSRIDFGIGDEAYKTQWLTTRRELWGIMAYNRQTPRGAMLAAMMRGRRWARRARAALRPSAAR